MSSSPRPRARRQSSLRSQASEYSSGVTRADFASHQNNSLPGVRVGGSDEIVSGSTGAPADPVNHGDTCRAGLPVHSTANGSSRAMSAPADALECLGNICAHHPLTSGAIEVEVSLALPAKRCHETCRVAKRTAHTDPVRSHPCHVTEGRVERRGERAVGYSHADLDTPGQLQRERISTVCRELPLIRNKPRPAVDDELERSCHNPVFPRQDAPYLLVAVPCARILNEPHRHDQVAIGRYDRLGATRDPAEVSYEGRATTTTPHERAVPHTVAPCHASRLPSTWIRLVVTQNLERIRHGAGTLPAYRAGVMPSCLQVSTARVGMYRAFLHKSFEHAGSSVGASSALHRRDRSLVGREDRVPAAA